MKKKHAVQHCIIKLVLSIILFTTGTAQAGWLTAYGTQDDDMGTVIPSSQGGYYVTLHSNNGSSDTVPSKPTQLLSLLATDGTPQWTKKISTGDYDDFSTTELSDGRLLVQGNTQTYPDSYVSYGDGYGYAVWALYQVNRVTGKLTQVFRSLYKNFNAQLSISQDAQGALWAQGKTHASSNNNYSSYINMIVAKINANTGVPEWSSILNYALNNSYVAAFTPKGNQFVLVANTGDTSNSNQNVLIGLLNNRGIPVAKSFKKYGIAGINNAQGLKSIANGNYLLYGTTTSTSAPDTFGFTHKNSAVFVVKLDANLNIIWGKKYNIGQDTSFTVTEINESSDGSFTLNGGINTMMAAASIPLARWGMVTLQPGTNPNGLSGINPTIDAAFVTALSNTVQVVGDDHYFTTPDTATASTYLFYARPSVLGPIKPGMDVPTIPGSPGLGWGGMEGLAADQYATPPIVPVVVDVNGVSWDVYRRDVYGSSSIIVRISSPYIPLKVEQSTSSYTTRHPATIQLSATGDVLLGKSFELDAMDTAFFFKNADETNSLSGQTTQLDFTNPSANPTSDSDMLYGAFDANFTPSWLKTLGGTGIDSGNISPIASGYGLTGMSSSWGAGKLDLLVGELDDNGNISGCTDIKDVTMTEKALTVTASNLSWTPQPAKITRQGAIKKANFTNLKVSPSPTITATPVCSD